MFRNKLSTLLFLSLMVPALHGARFFRALENEPVTPNRLIVRLRPKMKAPAVFAAAAPGAHARDLGRLNLHVLEFPQAVSQAKAEALASDPAVEYVEPDRIRHTTLAPPDDEKYSSQWALNTVEALGAWGLLPARYLSGATPQAQRIKIAVLDSGADCTHPDFRNAGGTSTDSEQGGQFLFRSSKAFVQTTVASPACAWQDDFGHGTHVAGTIAAAANNERGVAGLAYPAQLVIYKVLDSTGHGPDSGIARAIMEAADAGAVVISMSLGEVGYSQTLQQAVDYAWQRNVLVVAAAGNDNAKEMFFPASANHVLAVAAIDKNNAKASFSNFGPFVRIAAPGVGILSTVPSYTVQKGLKDYAYYSGTSMAAPHVSAAAGLVAMTTPGLAADAIALRLQQSANSTPGEWNERLGYGVLNASHAVGGALRQAKSGGIAGQVLDPAGDPIAGAQISTQDAAALSETGGLYRIWNEPAGTHTVHAHAPGYDPQEYTVVVPEGADAPLTIVMGAELGTITGSAMSEGAPLAGSVVAALSGGLVRATAVADGAGRFWLSVPPGTYDVRASAVSHEAGTAPSQAVRAGATQSVDIVLPRMGWITGSLKDGSGRAVADAQVYISGEGVSAGARTGPSGAFSTLGLPPGTYSVSASASGASGKVDGVWIVADYAASINLELGGSGTQTAAHTQAPNSTTEPVRGTGRSCIVFRCRTARIR